MRDDVLRFLLIVPLQALLVFGVCRAAWRWARSRRPSGRTLPIMLDQAGHHVVPLVAAFTGVRALPWLALAHNNLNPMLVIGPAGIAFRVLRRSERSFEAIDAVELRTFGATVVLSFSFRGSVLTFDASVGSEELAVAVLARLDGRVRLAPNAAALIA